LSKFDFALQSLHEARVETLGRLEALEAAIKAINGTAELLALPAPTPAPMRGKPAPRAATDRELAGLARAAKSRAKPERKPRSERAGVDNRTNTFRDDKIRALHAAGELSPGDIMENVGLARASAPSVFQRLGLTIAKKKSVEPGRGAIKAPATTARRRTGSVNAAPPATPPAAAYSAPDETQPAPTGADAPPDNDEATQIAEFLERRGASKEVDWGPHAAIIEAAKSMSLPVFRLKYSGRGPHLWSVNHSPEGTPTKHMYERVNAELRRRGRAEIPLPRETEDVAA
jgi:hypothetical protein